MVEPNDNEPIDSPQGGEPSQNKKPKLFKSRRELKEERATEEKLSSAEAYESRSLDELILEAKGDYQRELKAIRDEYEVKLQRQNAEIERLKFELEKKSNAEAELKQQLNQTNERLAAIEERVSPKESQSKIEQQREEIRKENAQFEAEAQRELKEREESVRPEGLNPQGKGGLPGSKQSSGVAINQDFYIGDRVKLGKEDGEELTWDPEEKKYQVPLDGRQYTFFSAEAAYLNERYDCQQNAFYSQTLFKKQVWYDVTPKGRVDDGIGSRYGGKVPLDYFMKEIAERLNARVFLASGDVIEKQDFRKAFKNWRYKYQVGKFYKTREGDLYSINEIDESRSQGNPPSFRTAGRDVTSEGITAGQKVPTKAEQRRNWIRNRKL